jgi:hypothetical protein
MSMHWNITIVMASMMLIGMGNVGIYLLVRQRHSAVARRMLSIRTLLMIYVILYDACCVIRTVGVTLCAVGVWCLSAIPYVPRISGFVALLSWLADV